MEDSVGIDRISEALVDDVTEDYKKLLKEIYESQKKLAKFNWQIFTAKTVDKKFRCQAKVKRIMEKLTQLAIVQEEYKKEMSVTN